MKKEDYNTIVDYIVKDKNLMNEEEFKLIEEDFAKRYEQIVSEIESSRNINKEDTRADCAIYLKHLWDEDLDNLKEKALNFDSESASETENDLEGGRLSEGSGSDSEAGFSSESEEDVEVDRNFSNPSTKREPPLKVDDLLSEEIINNLRKLGESTLVECINEYDGYQIDEDM